MRNGFAVIVNNYEFVNGNIRKGSEHDLDNLHNLLEELNFVVHIDTDLTAQVSINFASTILFYTHVVLFTTH